MSEQLIRSALENIEAFNAGDWNRLRGAVAADVVYDEIGSQRRVEGAEKFVESYQGWKKAAPDCIGTVKSTLTGGNIVAVEVRWDGTQTGPLGDIPASGKKWSVPGVQMITLENGKIKELRQYFDMLTILQQIGAATR